MKFIQKSMRISTQFLVIFWMCTLMSQILAQSTVITANVFETSETQQPESSDSTRPSKGIVSSSSSSQREAKSTTSSSSITISSGENLSTLLSGTSVVAKSQTTTPNPLVSTAEANGTTYTSVTSTIRSNARSKSSRTSRNKNNNTQSVFDPARSFGKLCQEENDEVGRKLGCDCKYNNGNSIAFCSNRRIKIGSSAIPLPNKLNVSSHIKTLDLSSNAIDRIDESTFNEVEGITELNLSKNQITQINGLNFLRLQSLDLSHNRITNLSSSLFQNTSKLLYLDLSHNNLTFIDIATFTTVEYLQILKLGFNPLENIQNYMEIYPFVLNNMTYLEELDLTNGSLPDFPAFVLQGTTNLRRLILKNNLLTYMPTGVFAHLPLLEELDLSGNYFTSLPPDSFDGLGHLKNLFIDRGRALERIEEYAFSGLSSLQLLSCENNYHLNYIDVRAFRGNPKWNTSECNPKEVRLAYNNLNHFEFPLLKWPSVESIELFGNPWICDCNLQWVSEFSRRAPANASVLIDRDFICEGPKLLKGAPVVDIDPDEMYCESPEAMVAGIIAIAIVSFILICFVVMIVLYQFQMLPERFEKFIGVLGRTRSSLPKYSKVQPKPSGIRHHRLVNQRSPDTPADMDWDTGDIGHLNY